MSDTLCRDYVASFAFLGFVYIFLAYDLVLFLLNCISHNCFNIQYTSLPSVIGSSIGPLLRITTHLGKLGLSKLSGGMRSTRLELASSEFTSRSMVVRVGVEGVPGTPTERQLLPRESNLHQWSAYEQGQEGFDPQLGPAGYEPSRQNDQQGLNPP